MDQHSSLDQFGACVFIVGPSGAGKDTLMDYARAHLPRDGSFHFVRRMITRPVQAQSEDHDSCSLDDFETAQKAGAFALVWQSHGLHYGLPISMIADMQRGVTVIANISRTKVEEAEALAKTHRCRATLVTITASPDILLSRLTARGRENAQDIAARLKREAPCTTHYARAVTILNDSSVEEAGQALVEAIKTA
jgi:ribose 1,5-bisphosphokinase